MKRPFLKLVVGVVLSVAIIIYCLAVEPAKWVQTSPLAWIAVRLITAGIAFFLAFLSFTSGKLLLGKKELKLEKKYLKDKDDTDLRGLGFSSFDIWLIEAPFYTWIAWWIICFEVMATFYVSDWCLTGF